MADKILVVDDESSIRNLCYDLFTADGHQVVTIATADQVLALVKTEKPDLVLLDIQMPGEDGLSLLKRMPNEKGKRVPVVLFSGFVTQDIEKEAYEAGAIEVIRKGIASSELRQKINQILSAKHRIFGDAPVGHINTILIVDDEENMRELLKTFFEGKGFRILTAKNGEEALLWVKKEHPTMILLDVTMPGMDGILTLKKIREIDPQVGVVMATGIQDEAVAQEATSLGAYAYVLKPYDLKYLELVVLTRVVMSS